MTVFSSLQTLAEKYEEARLQLGEMGLDPLESLDDIDAAEREWRFALRDAWPLLEAAVKALEEIARDDTLVKANEDAFSVYAYRRCREIAQFALSSLTGEPR